MPDPHRLHSNKRFASESTITFQDGVEEGMADRTNEEIEVRKVMTTRMRTETIRYLGKGRNDSGRGTGTSRQGVTGLS
jgi:hypothetical protein